MLVEAAQLAKQSSWEVLDTRSKDEYARGHIPGALWVDVPAWQELGKTEGGFHNATAWREKVGQLGIDHDSQVVVYGGRLPDTARIWWTLKYLGLEHVLILNGGWDVWVKENRPTNTDIPKVVAKQFEPKFQQDRLEEIGTLKQSVRGGQVKVVDARSSDEFTGKEVRGRRSGHIAGATHLEWKELLAQDGRFKTREQLQEVFRKRGILPNETAVCY